MPSLIAMTLSALLIAQPASQSEPPSPDAPATQPAASRPADARGLLIEERFDNPRRFRRMWQSRGMSPAVAPLGEEAIDGVDGSVLTIVAEPGSYLERRPSRKPFTDGDTLVFRMDAMTASKDKPLTFDVRFVANGRAAWRSHPVTVTEPGWTEHRLRLSRFACPDAGHADWQDARRLGFRFRRQAMVALDGIELHRGERPGSAYLSHDDLATMAFDARPVRRVSQGPFVVLSDADALDLASLAAALEQLAAAVAADFPDAAAPDAPIPLLIFESQDGYDAFWPLLFEHYGASPQPVAAQGFAALGVAGGYCGDEGCDLRPVWVHEAAHVLLASVLGLSPSPHWLHEGLATRYQLRHTGQQLGELVRAARTSSEWMDFQAMIAGDTVEPQHYWQAAALVSFLLDQPEWRPRFDGFLRVARRQAVVNLASLGHKAMNVAPSDLERLWREWLEQSYPQ